MRSNIDYLHWPTDFVQKQSCIARDSRRALDELLFLHAKLEHVDAERPLLYPQSTKTSQRLVKLQRECDQQSSRARRSEHAKLQAETRFRDLEVLRKVLEKKVNVLEKKVTALEVERDQERVRADHLQRQLSKLQGEVRQGQKSVHAALQKLTRSPAVAKRIAAVFHPDKCPSELSDVAGELFRFVQSNRERGAD